MYQHQHRMSHPARHVRTILAALALALPATLLGAGAAAAAPSAGYTASFIPTGAEEYAAAVDSQTDTVYLTAIFANEVNVVNGATGAVGTPIALTGSPRGIAVDPVTDTIYVSLVGSTVTNSPAVAVIDGTTGTVTHTIALPLNAFPVGIAVDSSTDTVYVADESTNAVSVIDGSTNSVTTTISLANGPLPFAVAVDETSDVVWVGGLRGSVIAISGASKTVTETISLGGVPVEGVAVSPANTTLYAATSTDGVAVISTATGTVSTHITGVTASALGIAIDPSSGTVYASGTAGSGSGTTWVIDATSNTIADTIPRGGAIAVNGTTGSSYIAPFNTQTNGAWVLTPSATNAWSPVIKSASASFYAGTSSSFAIVGSALPVANYSETGALPSGLTLSPSGVLSGTLAADSGGAYPLTITASNGISPSYSQAFILDVLQAPTLATPTTTTLTVGTTTAVPLQVTGFPEPTVTATSLPNGVFTTQSSPGNWTLAGVPSPGAGGLYTAQLTAFNGIGSPATATMAITVLEAPSFTSAAATTFETGFSNSFSFSAHGYPTPLTFAETGKLPAGVTLSQAGTLSGTPATGTAGTYPITVTATNATGTATQAFTLTVTAPPAPEVAVVALGPGGVPFAQAPQLGSGWVSLGGTLTSVPAVAGAPPTTISPTPASPLFIAPGTNHLLYIRGVTGSWERIGPNNIACLSVAAAITNNVLQVACETTSHGLSYNTATLPPSGLPEFTSKWTSLGGTGTLAAGPAVARVNGTLTFFVTGTDGKIHTRTTKTGFTATGWACKGQPAAAVQDSTATTFFACQGLDNGLYESSSTATGWSPLTKQSGTLAAGPAIAPTMGTVVLLLEGTNHRVYEGTPGSTYTRLGSLTVTGVEAAALN